MFVAAHPSCYMEWNASERGRSTIMKWMNYGGRWNWHSQSIPNDLSTQIEVLCNEFLIWKLKKGILTNNKQRCDQGEIYGFKGIRPKRIEIPFKKKIKTSNYAAWKQAQKTKDIIVSDYVVLSGSAVQEPEFTLGEPGGYAGRGYVTSAAMIESGFRKSHKDFYDRISMGGGAVRFYCRTNFYEYSEGEYLLPTSVVTFPERFLSLYEELEYSKPFVTNVISKADIACMDILTAAAEMPQTIKSAISALKSVAEMVRSAKRREFAVSKAHLAKLERMKQKGLKTLALLERDLALAKNKRSKDAIQRKMKAERKAQLRVIRETAKEFTDAVANVWLTFRYEIMPIVYTVEDAVRLVNALSAEFKTTRDRITSNEEFELDGHKISFDLEHKMMIKRLLDPKMKFQSLTAANVLYTGYQLIPWTFVLDWFINAGDVLVAYTSPNYSLKEGATYSFKSDINYSKDGFTFKAKIYKRFVIDPQQHIGFGISESISTVRLIDAVALLWRPIKDALQRSKRN